jgi:tetratricopeptide (TPR) repeat protein
MLATESTTPNLPFTIRLGVAWASFFLLSNAIAAPDFGKNSIRLETFRTHSRLVFFIERNVKTKIKVDTQGFELRAKDITMADLGIPFGKEKEIRAFYGRLQDSRVKNLKVFEDRAELVFQGQWKFPTGEKELHRPAMEFFDYRDSAADQLIVDFWVKDGPTVAEVRRLQEIAQKKKVADAQVAKIRRRKQRRLASIKRTKDAEEILEFCQAPLSDERDLFLKFESYHEDVDFDRIMGLTRPDQNYTYLIPRANTEDADLVKLAVKLYRQSKLALAVKAIEFLNRDYPESPYHDEMVFLKANALIKLGLNREGESLLKESVTLRRDHPTALYAAMFLAKQRMAKQEYLAALNHFLWLINQHGKHEMAWLFHLGAAETLFRLRQTQRAASQYQWIISNVDDLNLKGDAAARIGDLFMDRGSYEQGLAAYYRAAKYFPEESRQSATLQINRGEALFQLGQFDRAEKVFTRFLKTFRTHPEGWRAAYRLAVIHGRKEPRGSDGSYRKYLYKSINDFPASPAATLARVRLAACGDHGGFDFRSLTAFFKKDALTFRPVDQVRLEAYEDMRHLEEARAALSMGREWYAVDIAARELDRKLAKVAQKEFERIFVDGFRKELRDRLARNETYDALAFYSRYRETFSAINQKGVLTEFMLQLARGASDLGLGRLAQQIIASYRKAGVHRSIAQEDEEPLTEDLLLESEEAFTEAHAIWTEKGIAAEEKIREILKKVHHESPLSFEKHILLSRMYEEEKELDRAIAEMFKAKTLAEKYRLVLLARVDYHIVNLYRKVDKKEAAVKTLRGIQTRVGAAETRSPASIRVDLPLVPSETELLVEEATLLEGLSKWSEATDVYRRAMKRGLETPRVKYLFARSLMKSGRRRDKAEALRVLESMSTEDGDGFWKEMATNTIESEKAKEGEQ